MSLAPDTYYALVEVFIFLAFAELLTSVIDRIGVPAIVGYLVLGMALGNFALGGILNSLLGIEIFHVTPYVLLFADFSVVLLLFAAGLGVGFQGLRESGGLAVLGAIAGDLVPFAAAFLVFSRFYSLNASLLLGVAAAATSAAVVAALRDSERIGDTRGSRFFMSLAALDDVVALVLLTVVLTIVGGRFDIIAITGNVVESIIAWLILLLAAVLVIPRLLRVRGLREAKGMPFLFLFVLVAVVVSLGFSAVIGAFIAGLAVAESLVADRTRVLTELLLLLFGSLFFVVTGAQFDVRLLTSLALVGGGLLLGLVAAGGKVLGVYPVARARLGARRPAIAVAIGMIPRGEIGLIVGTIGLMSGLFNATMFGEVVLMCLATTLVGSVLFRRVAPSLRPDQSGQVGAVDRPEGIA